MTSVDRNPDGTGAHTPRARRAVHPAVEVLGVLLAPLAAFVLYGGRRMVPIRMIDPSFYTAYAQHGPDLITRYGPDNYYWVRQGFVLPARLADLAFGAVPGFLVLRYVFALLAVAPAYLLLRRLHGPLAGALGVAVILTSQVVLAAWGTDYPDSSAVAYLFAGAACLFMPPPPPGERTSRAPRLRRLAWVVGAGAALSLAVHSQLYAAPLVVALVLAYLVTYRRAGDGATEDSAPSHRAGAPAWLEAMGHAAVLAVLFVLVTGVLVVSARAVFGSGDMIQPTIDATAQYRTPAEIAKWHSTTWRWIVNDPYLAVPPAVVGGWLLVVAGRWRTGARPGWPESGIVIATALQGLAYAFGQFVGQVAALEFFFYSSMLWPGVCLTTAFLLVRVTDGLVGRPLALRMLPLVLVLATPWAFVPWTPELRLDLDPAGVVLFVAVLAAVAVGTWWRQAAVAVVVVAAVLAGTHALVVGIPVAQPQPAGQVPLPDPPYNEVTGFDDQEVYDRYVVLARLPDVVPLPDGVGNDDLMLWWPAPTQTLNRAAAQYLWQRNGLPITLPVLTDEGRRRLDERQPEHLVLLSETGDDFAAAIDSLVAAGFQPVVERTETIRRGATELHVEVVGLTGYGA